jgi:hypothetical protein
MNAVRSSSLAAMLTIGSSVSPEVGSKYCDAQVAAGAEDYCLGRDESRPGSGGAAAPERFI